MEEMLRPDTKAQLRRIHFVPAKFQYKLQANDSLIFTESTDTYSISYGGSLAPKEASAPKIFDTNILERTKAWARFYKPGKGFVTSLGNGFALSVIFSLQHCPVFRQFTEKHRSNCSRVGCTLCKLQRCFEASENATEAVAPDIDIEVIQRDWKPGVRGDSAEFMHLLFWHLLEEELASSRSFATASKFSSGTGQIFYAEVEKKVQCKECGRLRAIKEGRVVDVYCRSASGKHDVQCDACGGECSIEEMYLSAPYLYVMQFPHWNRKGQFSAAKKAPPLECTVAGHRYRLTAFTTYAGDRDNHGKYGACVLSSSGAWHYAYDGKIRMISLAQLGDLIPSLCFYSRNEQNMEEEKGEFIVAEPVENILPEERPDMIYDPSKFELPVIETIFKQNDKPVVDTTKKTSRKVDRSKVTKPASNPLQKLLSASNVHNVSGWGDEGTEFDEPEPVKEKALDEWDAELDKGKLRKAKKKREVSTVNPFENPPNAHSQRRPNRWDRNRGNDRRRDDGPRSFGRKPHGGGREYNRFDRKPRNSR